MLPANKHFTPVLGIDIHFVIILGIPVPIPHPYIGIVIDPMDYVPIIGSTVIVNNVPKGNSGTAGRLGISVHIPLGGPFLLTPMIGHDSMNFFGSTRVNVEDAYFTPAGYMTMTCNDIGIPLSLAPGKKMKPIPSLYLPTSMSIPMPFGKPVIVGGPYAPDLMGMLMGLVMSYGFGAIMKGLGKGLGKGLKVLNNKLLKKFPATQGLNKKLCKMGFEPVDLVTGRMIYEGEDFNLPGPLPISWKRNWYSDSDYEGIMGYGMHCNYDIALHSVLEEDTIVMRLPDGRITQFPLVITEHGSAYNRLEKLTLTCIDSRTYTISDHEKQQTYTFKKFTETLFKPVKLENAEGFNIRFTYNGVYQLEYIIDSAGRKLELHLEESKIAKITVKHEGQQRTLVSYTYNETGDLTEITDALGQTTSMDYDNHLMVEKTDRNGQAFYWEYDGKKTGARCTRTWGDGGILSGTLEYCDGYNIITNSLGQQSIYYFNELNLCTQVTDPMGGNTYHQYTSYMEPYRNIDQEGNMTGYTYDKRGNLTGVHQPDGAVTSFLYDEKDRLTLTKYPTGSSVVRTFKEDRLHAVIGVDGGVTSFEYNEEGLIREVRDNAGNLTQLYYDKDHNLGTFVTTEGYKTTWKYDVWGRCLQVTNAQGGKQQYAYDALDRIKHIRQADSNVVRLKYNAYDEVIETTDSKHHKVRFNYTPLGSLKEREENGKKIHFHYNTEEELLTITNEHKEFYRFARNKNGQIHTEIGFDGLTRKYHRDRAGKVLRTERPDNRFTEYEYDLNGRITRAEHHDGTWETYSYDQDGNLVEAVNEQSHVHLIRDISGRVVTENQDGHLVESTYDKLGNRTKITSSLGADFTLSRKQSGHLEEVTAMVTPQEGSSELKDPLKQGVWQAQFTYNSLGMETERMFPGGIRSRMQYDEAGRPIGQRVSRANKELRHRTYTWSVNEKLTNMVNELTQGRVTYGYDDFSNLASARYEKKQFDYKLPDEVGNLYRTKSKTDRKYGKGGQLLEADGKKFKYDKEGNLITKITEKGNWEYNWYGNGMLKSVIRPDDKKVQFEYDALGRRTAKLFNGEIERFVWDGNVPLHQWKYAITDRPQWVVDEFGEISKDREESIDNLTTWLFDEGTFKPAAKIINRETFSIITDYLGIPVEMYNAKGEKTWEVEYDIYGKVRKLAKGSLNDCPFRYQGQYEDVETGLYYNRFRYYSADEGVYLSQDPIRLESGEPNFYSYVRDSNSEIDPFGEAGMPWHHLIPQEMFKDPSFMKQLNQITGGNAKNYIHRQGAFVEESLHKAIHKGARGGKWNDTFKDWVADNKKFNKKSLQNQLKKMMKDNNIPKSSRNFARKYKRKTKTRFKCKG